MSQPRKYRTCPLQGDHEAILAVLARYEVSREPVYSAYGLEVYENPETRTQVRANWDTDTIEIVQGY